MRLLVVMCAPLLAAAAETSHLGQSPQDILRHISSKIASSTNITDAASDIKNFSIRNEYIYNVVNEKKSLEKITEEMGKFFKIQQALAAFAIELPGSQKLFIELIKKAKPQDRQTILSESLALVDDDFTISLAKKLITYYFKNNFLTDANAWQGETLPITRKANHFFQLGDMLGSLVVWEYLPIMGRKVAAEGIPPLRDLTPITEHHIDEIDSDKNRMGNIYGVTEKELVTFWFLEKPTTSSNKTRIIFGTYNTRTQVVKSFQFEL